MEEKDVKIMVDESVGKMKDELIKELKPESDKAATVTLTPAETKTLTDECKGGKIASCGKLSAAGVDIKTLKFDIESMEAFKTLKADKEKLEANVEELNTKLGIDPAKKSLEGQNNEDKKGSTKSDADFYKDAGMKGTGRPL